MTKNTALPGIAVIIIAHYSPHNHWPFGSFEEFFTQLSHCQQEYIADN
jgi:hypothetical protein